MPHCSSVPGLKFSTRTSASAISLRATSWPSGLRRSTAIERLLRDCTCHQTEVPSFIRRQLRNGSPFPGASILITSAPNSPSVLPAKGPAMSCPISITRIPASAPGGIGGVLIGVSSSAWARDFLDKLGGAQEIEVHALVGLRHFLEEQLVVAAGTGRRLHR